MAQTAVQPGAGSPAPVAPPAGPRVTQVLRGAGEVLLWAAATLGVLCALLALLTSTFGFRVMLFSSGSMEPSISVGSAALVRTVDAAEIEVGDIVTVARGAGQLPVTHRVVAVEAADDPAARLLTLRGDANAQDDPAPYEVTEAGRVVFSVPGVAPAVAQLGNPRVLGPLGVVAAVFVIWGLWPRRQHGVQR